eukprot:sb/3470714/
MFVVLSILWYPVATTLTTTPPDVPPIIITPTGKHWYCIHLDLLDFSGEGLLLSRVWTAVERGAIITCDLETTSLHVKTDSILGSGDRLAVNMYNLNEDWRWWRVLIYFESQYMYSSWYCMTSTAVLPVQPKEGITSDMIWSFAKSSDTLTVSCDGVELLVYEIDRECEAEWLGDVIERVQFSPSQDTASDFYAIGDIGR